MSYELIDHTGDAGISVQGGTLEELFQEAAKGFTDVITEIDTIEAIEEKQITLSASDTEKLLVDWLSELLFLFDTERFLGREFTVTFPEPLRLEATVKGETFDTTTTAR